MTPISAPPPLEVYLLGLVDFDDAQRLQRRLIYDLGETGGAALVLCEHPPTISVGRSGSRLHIVPDDETLRALGVPVRWVNRGGGCVLHLPGQLCAYLALPLDRLGLPVMHYVVLLHDVAIDVLAEFEIRGVRRPDQPGVFLGYRRVASVGIAVHRWISSYGLTLNVGPYLEPFERMIDEPGIGPYPLRQTSLEARRQRPALMSKVREAFIRHAETRFRLERHHLYSHHPLIRRKVLAHAYAPTPG